VSEGDRERWRSGGGWQRCSLVSKVLTAMVAIISSLFPRRQREKPLAVGVVIVVVVEFSIADCDLGMVVWL
jgi:anti-sigma-K factor RskA